MALLSYPQLGISKYLRFIESFPHTPYPQPLFIPTMTQKRKVRVNCLLGHKHCSEHCGPDQIDYQLIRAYKPVGVCVSVIIFIFV